MSDETGFMQRIQSSFGNCSSSVPKQSNNQMGISGQMRNLSVDSSNKKPTGIPPSRPNFPPPGPHSPFANPKMAAVQQVSTQNYAMGPSHSRSMSQPAFFSFDHLPPLSPSTFTEPPQTSVSDRALTDLHMEDRERNLQGSSVPPSFTGVSSVHHIHSNEGLPPRRGHRRSSSDVPMGFMSMSNQGFMDEKDRPAQLMLKRESDLGGIENASTEGERKAEGEVVDDLFSAYMNLDNIDALNSSSMDEKDLDSRASGTRTNDSSENEVESSLVGNGNGNSTERRDKGIRGAPGDIAPAASRHFRSLSMDSFMGSMSFSDESPRLPPSPGIRSAQHSPSSSFDGNTNKFSVEFGNGEFSAAEMKKIMANEKLAEMAMADPKRVKRILANRQSAARSKERKLRYIAELEHKVQTLQTEATTLSAQLTLLQRDSTGLTSQNNELRFRLQAMEQQAQLKDALNEALTAEVQRLKLAMGELRGEANNLQHLQHSHYNLYQHNRNNPKQEQPQPQEDVKPPK